MKKVLEYIIICSGINMHEIGLEQSPAYVDIPINPDMSNIFWVDPEQLARIGGLVNSAKLTTMAIGVESRRQGLISTSVEEKLQPLFESLPNRDSGIRAFEVGIMYGNLLHADDSAAESKSDTTAETNRRISSELLAEMASSSQGLDLTSEVDNFNLFMTLRDLEVDYAGTDVIAFCLAGTQDHIRNIFYQTSGSDTPPSSEELLTVQSMYYAGVLLGAIESSDKQLPQPRVEIVRGRRDPVENVSARIKFAPGDDLSSSIDYYLRSKYLFKPVGVTTNRRSEPKPAISIIPNGMQFAPNSIDVPIYAPGLSEYSSVTTVLAKDIDAVLIKPKQVDDNLGKVRIEIDTKVEDLFYDQDSLIDSEIVGLIVGNHLVSAIDPSHPWASGIEELILNNLSVDEKLFEYSTELQLWEATSREMKLARHSTKFAALFALAWPWLVDGVEALTGQDSKVEWSYNIPIDMLILGAMGVWHFGRKALEQMHEREHGSAKKFDELFQDGVDKGILR